MATKKTVAHEKRVRNRSAALRLWTVIEYTREGGETVARVRDKATQEYLAVVKGSKAYARRCAEAFAVEWATTRARWQPALERQLNEVQRIKSLAVSRATRAAQAACGGAP